MYVSTVVLKGVSVSRFMALYAVPSTITSSMVKIFVISHTSYAVAFARSFVLPSDTQLPIIKYAAFAAVSKIRVTPVSATAA